MLKVQTPYRRLMSVVCLYPIMIILDKLTGWGKQSRKMHGETTVLN